MANQVDTSTVLAACAGDRTMLDELAVQYLPLVYNIVHRAVHSDADDADVDDVVQETMIRLVQGIGGLREPERLRSWLVAITVGQIREHSTRRHAAPMWMEEHDEHPDPDAGFADRTLTRLALEQQRQELESAAQWLDPADRELFSLWALECGGHVTRAEITDALRVNPHYVAVKVARLRDGMDAARLLTRALSAVPRCSGLTNAADQWPGEPNPLWRSRMLRHVGGCSHCRGSGSDLVPVRRLLLGAVLLPIPVGYPAKVLPGVHGPVATATDTTRQLPRIAGVAVTKPLVVAAGVVLAAACGVAVALVTHVPDDRAAAVPITTSEVPAPSSTTTTSTTTTSPTPATSSATSTTAAKTTVPSTTTVVPTTTSQVLAPSSTTTSPTPATPSATSTTAAKTTVPSTTTVVPTTTATSTPTTTSPPSQATPGAGARAGIVASAHVAQ